MAVENTKFATLNIATKYVPEYVPMAVDPGSRVKVTKCLTREMYMQIMDTAKVKGYRQG